MTSPNHTQFEHKGHRVDIDVELGHLWVTHNGAITWDELQEIKTKAWGPKARAIEVYPSDVDIVNTANMRHLWLLGPDDFCPDLLGRDRGAQGLQARHAIAWNEARTT